MKATGLDEDSYLTLGPSSYSTDRMLILVMIAVSSLHESRLNWTPTTSQHKGSYVVSSLSDFCLSEVHMVGDTGDSETQESLLVLSLGKTLLSLS